MTLVFRSYECIIDAGVVQLNVLTQWEYTLSPAVGGVGDGVNEAVNVHVKG